jgi:hypothetical protein
VKVSLCNSIADITAQENYLQVYPNPNTGEFVVRSSVTMDLQLVNELGQIVQNIRLSATTGYLASVKDLATGIYFLTGKTAHGNINQKIVVER